MISAVGSSAIECFCDTKTEKFGPKNRRFSPGYGDLDLKYQPLILNELSALKHTGITLLENLMMTPSKSVTAIIGIEKEIL